MVTIEKAALDVSRQALARFAQRTRRLAGVRGQVNVTITSSRQLRALNRRYRGKDQPTDVLSFPAMPEVAGRFVGDIVISADVAARTAREYGHALSQELKVLILHGMLHLAGLDHERDRGQMARKEERLRRTLNLNDGLISRASTPSRARRRKS